MANGRTPGDPQLVGVPVFVTGSIALGFQLVEYVNAAALGAPLAIILMLTGLFLLVATLWAAYEGQSWPAGFFALFGGFWLSYGVLVLGLIHGWFAIPPDDVQHTVAAFAISFAAIFTFMTISALRLPLLYPLIIALVVVALCLVAVAYLQTPVSESTLNVAGIVVWVFAGLGAWVYLAVADISLGGKGVYLGPVLLKPPSS